MSEPRFLVWETRTHVGRRYAALYYGELPRHDSEAAKAILVSYKVAPNHDGLGLDELSALRCYACPPAAAEPVVPTLQL